MHTNRDNWYHARRRRPFLAFTQVNHLLRNEFSPEAFYRTYEPLIALDDLYHFLRTFPVHSEGVPTNYVKVLDVLDELDTRPPTRARIEILTIVIAATDRGILPYPIEASRTAQPLTKVVRKLSASAEHLRECGSLNVITSIGVKYYCKGRRRDLGCCRV